MQEKFLCVMAGYDAETETRLAGLQNMLYENGFCGRHTKDIPQHITLGSFPLPEEDRLTTLLKDAAEKTRAFPVTFNHLGIFGGAQVLFVAPDASHALLSLKEIFGESFNWTPHTTMLIDDSEQIFAAQKLLTEKFSAFAGTVESLHLYEFWPTRHILTVRLEKQIDASRPEAQNDR